MNFVSSHPAFNDTIDSLKNEFKDDHSNSVIICGAHDFSRTESIDKYKTKYDKVIVFNQEPLMAKQRNFMHIGYFAWLKAADEVWDYDDMNLRLIRSFRPDAQLHTLKPYKVWPSSHPKDIDILFYGALNEHRSTILNRLAKQYGLKILTNCWGNELDSWILRSRILLNLHYYYECALQEQARMIRWIGAPCRIISEPSKVNYLNVEEFDFRAADLPKLL